ncbi:MAG TPA: hypothetical protein VEC02_05200 [Nitrososphaerales archaeon]|nr:hypothetical protein [Nitrososphaerales archaeon]
MKVERADDLVFWTYYIIDWGKVEQSPSGKACVQCGGPMAKVGPVEDAKGSKYEGLACHGCKRVIWVKSA